MRFPAVLKDLLALFNPFLVDILSRSQFLHTPPHSISTQIWTNYETHIFKSGGYVPPAPPPPWLRKWMPLCLSSVIPDVAVNCSQGFWVRATVTRLATTPHSTRSPHFTGYRKTSGRSAGIPMTSLCWDTASGRPWWTSLWRHPSPQVSPVVSKHYYEAFWTALCLINATLSTSCNFIMQPSLWNALSVAPRPCVRLSVRQYQASDFLERGKP